MSSGVVCYWEKQEADKLCAVHCLNGIAQGPVYTAEELGQIATELDREEETLGLRQAGDDSHNVDSSGNFSISVIEKALAKKGWQAVNLDREDIKNDVYRNCQEETFICNSHARQHWFTLRKVNGRWWNLDSLRIPTSVSEFGLVAFLESTIQSGFTIFVIRSFNDESRVGLPQMNSSTQVRYGRQFYLTEADITKLQEAAKKEGDAAIKDAQDVAGEGSSKPAYTMIGPAGKNPEKTDWTKVGAGECLGGGAVGGTSMDDELQQALRASLENVPEPPPEAPEEGEGTNIQVRLPKGGKLQRRWALSATILDVSMWCEYVSVKDASLGLPPLPSCEYSLLKQGFPKKDKYEKKNGSISLDGADVSAKSLKDLQFSRQEALILQL